jgi:branched-chain amino acid transport system permease protein
VADTAVTAPDVRPHRPSLAAADLRYLGYTALGLAVFPYLFHLIGGYGGLATQILIVGIGAIGFNILLGYAGLLSYGHAMFYGTGGYVAAIVLTKVMASHPSFLAPILCGVAFTALLALVIGALVVRLYGIYFALLTVAFAQMVFFVVFQWRDLTGGDDGIQGITVPPLNFGFAHVDLSQALPALSLGPLGDLSDVKLWYPFAALVLLAVLYFTRVLVRSQFGEVLAAIRENEERSTFIGFNPTYYKLAAFVISGTLTGLSGALRALYENSVATDSLSIDQSGSFVIFTIVGGAKTIFGPLVGTGLIMYLQNVISAKTDAWRLIEGLIFVAIVVFLPSGILGRFTKGKMSLRGLLRTK